ncbi:unnamed protein product [Kuraishia capsulata CBS 1993]|uniref:Protein farnesyltransferase subunit beta n=1 Tax=Kuraishia capsulata CBS 1993 TaxID=1382522 RepID=W6MVA7_9ASCO|nr:uncharacterized protein KUCA_T00002146001 [Kuraishia capsulata CBS 1993]CDK26175.1 unnamed protein product [Kuraishia capsulata CBS 1993]
MDWKLNRFDTLVEMVSFPAPTDSTATTRLQLETETPIREYYETILEDGSQSMPELTIGEHVNFLKYFLLNELPAPYKAYDASHPWLMYWLTNGLELLKVDLSEYYKQISNTVISYGSAGMGGGMGQIPHVASTYAGLMTLAITGENWKDIDRRGTYDWLMSLKNADGSFKMHSDGETDARAVYCALCVARVLDIMTSELTENTVEWLSRCQTYEGGFGGTPDDEAHSGYTFCAVAALCILDSPKNLKSKCDLDRLVDWISARQLPVEGGFQGRTNKLVDGCYSHWTGGLVPLIEMCQPEYFDKIISREALENYILCCCQAQNGGLRDKPGKSPDFYHSNYVLCGLSMCENKYELRPDNLFSYNVTPLKEPTVVAIDPIFGVPNGKVEKFRSFCAAQKW